MTTSSPTDREYVDVSPRESRDKRVTVKLSISKEALSYLEGRSTSGGQRRRLGPVIEDLIHREQHRPADQLAEEIGAFNAWMYFIFDRTNRRLTKADWKEMMVLLCAILKRLSQRGSV